MLNKSLLFGDIESIDHIAYRDCEHYLSINTPLDPVFLHCNRSLRLRSLEMQAGFPGTVSYAVKANPREEILQTLVDSGINDFDVASIGEIDLLRRIAPQSNLYYNNPVRSAEMVSRAYHDYQITSFSVDDLAGLSHLLELGQGVEVSVRFCLPHGDAAYDFGSKFGATPEEAVYMLQFVEQHGLIPSLTFHPGSQCTSPLQYHRYIVEAAAIARRAGVRLHRLNIGGGFPVPYADSGVGTLGSYMGTVVDSVQQAFTTGNAPKLMCEPGRAMVAGCTSLLTRVIHVRERGDVFLNDGIYGSLQEQVTMQENLPCRVWRDGALVTGNKTARTLFGPTCDPVDRLPRPIELPTDIAAGDYIEFAMLGAYGSATATRFNGFEPAEYMPVEEGYVSSQWPVDQC